MMTRSVRASSILLVAMMVFMSSFVSSQSSIEWWSIDGGGEILSTGGVWNLSGTFGQPDASEGNELAGGAWQMTGGFWASSAANSDVLFVGDFEG